MRLTIAAIGKMRAGPEASLVNDYLKRAGGMGRGIGLSGPDLLEFEAPRNLSGKKRQDREGELLITAVPSGAKTILLDERGENLNSEAFASLIARYRDDGAPSAAFLIGGADGHATNLQKNAMKILSFGAATWPHMLVRVMLAEQLYRAMTILTRHPYHRS
jgi:23S rRNA (pseudouridine1915-N3)-methyltransferase